MIWGYPYFRKHPFVAEHWVLKQLLCLTTSHYTNRPTDVVASRPYGVRRSIFVALLRQCAAAAPQWTSYLNRWVCAAVVAVFCAKKIVCFLLDFGFDMGKSGLKPTKKTTNAKDKSRTFTLWSYKSKSPFCSPFRGGSELSLSFNEALQNVEMPPVLTRVSWVVWSIWFV